MTTYKYNKGPLITAIVAVDSEWGIGKNNNIPWNCPSDREKFKSITSECPKDLINVVIMGRKTYQTINKPLSDRIIYIISNTININNDNIKTFRCINDAINNAYNKPNIHKIFIVGGCNIYLEGILHPLCNNILITKFIHNYNCDVKFPYNILKDNYTLEKNKLCNIEYDEYTYVRNNIGEKSYLELLNKIILNGDKTNNRTGIDTLSLFSENLRFDLYEKNNQESIRMIVPLLTTKHVSFRLIYEELLWFLRGDNTIDYLKEKNIHIWDANTSREFLDKCNLKNYREGEIGPGYGSNWRHFGAKYVCENDKKVYMLGIANKEIDQIEYIINNIKKNPFDRRHVLTAWNPTQLDEVALPACHLMSIFKVSPDVLGNPKWLSCKLVMRSADVFLGVPFNIVSYSILTHMIANITGLVAKELAVVMVDAHLYTNHIEQAKLQSYRQILGFPYIVFSEEIKKKINNSTIKIDDFVSDSIILTNYYSHNLIQADMAI